jgi:hypothetical protein
VFIFLLGNMGKVTFNGNLDKAVDYALQGAVRFLTGKIKKITPRDPARPPKDPSVPVTGNLERSVTYRKNKEKQHSYVIGIPSGFH